MKSGKLFIICIIKKHTKKVYNNLTKSIQLWKIDTIFMNSEKSKTSEPRVLMFKLADKLDLRRGEKSFSLSNLTIYYTLEIIKSSNNNNKFKISAPTWNDKFELPDTIFCIRYSRLFWVYFKKYGENINN